MTQKSNLIILDADVIISLNELGLWHKFLNRYGVIITKTVFDEAQFWKDRDEQTTYIDLPGQEKEGRITVIDPSVADLVKFRSEVVKWDSLLMDELGAGELHTLAAAFCNDQLTEVCLIDHAPIRCAGLIGLRERIVSVETALVKSGLKVSLPRKLSEAKFRKLADAAATERVQKMLL
ncbi:MAG: hypothetical protein KAT79_02130 [candidate division Zixibacteria bacterium]|nr:hypothetical protein [candidate division Zixibacteria bacterium]